MKARIFDRLARTPERPRDRVHEARRLRVRTRRQVTDVFAGHYVSALRGSGIEYSESRPYVPGDDVRSVDWNATARSGVPHVKQHRPERGRSVVAVIDGTPSMHFGTCGRTKFEAASEAAALLGAAALSVGDRFGLVRYEADATFELPPRRGELQLHLLFDALTGGRRGARPPIDAVDRAEQIARRRRRGELVFVFGDARRETDDAAPQRDRTREGSLPPHGRTRGEGIFVLCSDPGELRWPDAGPARVVGPSGPGLRFDGDDALARARFERAARRRVERVARAVRGRGDDFVHFRSDGDALRLWLRFFESRSGRGDGRGIMA